MLVNALALHDASDAARVFLENLIAELPGAWPQARVAVVAREGGAPLPGEERLDVVRVRSPRSGMARVAAEFARLPSIAARVDPDVVISPNESVPKRIGGPVVVVAQNLLFHCPGVAPLQSGPLRARLRSRAQFAFYRRQYPRAYARADAVVAVSRHAARELAERADLDPARVHVVPYGADRLPVRPRSDEPGPRRLLVVGAVAHYKRLEEAVAALALLREAGGDYELLLAGGAWPGYGEVVDEAARAAGVGPHVRRLGPVTGEGLAELFASSQAGLAISACESFGIPVVEGMRAGLPQVVADEPWSAETVGEAAVRVDGRDPASIAAGIRTLEDPSEWRRRAQAGREAAARYTWSANAAGIVAVAAAIARPR